MPAVRAGLGQAEQNGHAEPETVQTPSPAPCVPCMIARAAAMLVLLGLTAYLIYVVRKERLKGPAPK